MPDTTIESTVNSGRKKLEELMDSEAELVTSRAAGDERRTEIRRAIEVLQSAVNNLETLSAELKDRDRIAVELTKSYFKQIEETRKALAEDGELWKGLEDAEKEAKKTLANDEQSKLETLMGEVREYDEETQEVLAAEEEREDLAESLRELAEAEKTYDESKTALDRAFRALSSLASMTKGVRDVALKDVLKIKKLVKERDYEAIVHLQDLKQRTARLKDPINLDPDEATFDADEAEKETVTNRLTTLWSSARNEFESAANIRFEKRRKFLDAKIALETKMSEGRKRLALRLVDATKAVKEEV